VRISRDAAKVADEVVQHLTGLEDSDVTIRMEITAQAPAGVPDNVLRTVTENCRTLKFNTAEFEES
jgi:hypothetical protein